MTAFWRTLNAAEVDTANVGALVETKDGPGLVEGDVLGQAHNIPVESTTDVFKLGPLAVISSVEPTKLNIHQKR